MQTREVTKHNHVFLDIPLLFENGLDKNCDITITVYVTKRIRWKD